jgi:membrane protein DedA with SNARE-associated domain
MNWIKRLAMLLFLEHPLITIFLGCLVLGEDMLVFFSILSGRGLIPFWEVILFGFFGVLAGNTVYFFLAKTKLLKKIEKKIDLDKKYGRLSKLIYGLRKKNTLFLLIIAKFIISVRLGTVLYLSAKGMSYKKFIKQDLIAFFIWGAIMLPAGWLLGRGISVVFNVAHDFKLVLSIAILVFAVYLLVEWIVAEIVLKKLGLVKNK